MTHPMLDFIKGCLDEDQATAELIRDDLARRHFEPRLIHDLRTTEGDVTTTRHLRIYDPAAVLADITSKRALLAIHAPFDPVVKPDGSTIWLCGGCSADDGYWHIAWPCPTVRTLVSAFAAREGYSADWGPT